MKIIRYVSKENIKKLKNREINIHRFLEISSIEKNKNYYSWKEDEANILLMAIMIPDEEE